MSFLGWLSDPFKGYSDLQRLGIKLGHELNHLAQEFFWLETPLVKRFQRVWTVLEGFFRSTESYHSSTADRTYRLAMVRDTNAIVDSLKISSQMYPLPTKKNVPNASRRLIGVIVLPANYFRNKAKLQCS